MRRVAVAILALVLGFVGPVFAQTRVVFGLSTEGFLAVPFYIAEANGYFQREGIKAETVTLKGGPLTMTAALAGDIDVITAASIATVIQARAQRQDVRAFAAMVSQLASALVVQGEILQKAGVTESSPMAARLKVLKGLRIGITGPGSSTDKLARYLTSAAGYKPDQDVTIVPVGNSSAILASFSRQRIDAFILSSPTPEVAEQQHGGKTLVGFAKGEFDPLRHFLYSCLAARSDWLKQNPDKARRVVRAIASALAVIRDNPEQAKAALKPYFKNIDPKVFDASFRNNLPAYPSTPRIDPAGLENALVFTAATEGKRPDVSVQDLYTDEYLK